MLTEQQILEFKDVSQLIQAVDSEIVGGALTSDDIKWGLRTAGAFATWVGKNYTAAQKYPGEKHQPMWVDGTIKMASFSGPSTNLLQRLKDGDKPISYTDEVAKLHDIMYQRAALSGSREEMRRLKGEADKVMLNYLREGKNKKLDNKVNIGIAKLGISGKEKIQKYAPRRIFNWLEDKYTGDLETLSEEDVKIVNDEYEKTRRSLDEQSGINEQPVEIQEVQEIRGGALSQHPSLKGTMYCNCGCPESKMKKRISSMTPGFMNPCL